MDSKVLVCAAQTDSGSFGCVDSGDGIFDDQNVGRIILAVVDRHLTKRLKVCSGGIAEAVGAGKSIQRKEDTDDV